MKRTDLWERYCTFYESDFAELEEHNRKQMEKWFSKWKKTDLAKILCRGNVERYQDVPVTEYSDYTMLCEFGKAVLNETSRNPKRPGEAYREYYDRICRQFRSSLSRYMGEPFYLCMRSTGSTGESKWIAHGETFWKNFKASAIASAVLACSDGWGQTNLEAGDKALNLNAPIPYISGWGALASEAHLELVPSTEVADNLRDMKERFNLILKAIMKGEKIALGGGIGATFYMISKHFVEPYEFFSEYSHSMSFGLKKTLLYLKMLQCKLSGPKKRRIVDFMPLKGVLIAGTEAKLYIEFFKKEFGLDPLHNYGSTEAGLLMRGDPDRKTDLVPDLRTSFLEFKTEKGEMKGLDELKKGETYELVVTPFGSILFRYDMQDLLRVVDFRDDGMPIFAFEGREKQFIDIYGYRLSPNVVAQALSKAGLTSSDRWAVVKLLKPNEHLLFLMEKSWSYSEKEAQGAIFSSLVEADSSIPHRGRTLKDYIADFGINDPSEVVAVEYLKRGAFLRYSIKKGKAGSPIGQYKPPKIIPADKMEIYDLLRSV